MNNAITPAAVLDFLDTFAGQENTAEEVRDFVQLAARFIEQNKPVAKWKDEPTLFAFVEWLEGQPARSDTLDELTDEISDAISDSMDYDWTATDGAKAVVRMLRDNGYVVVQRGEDSDVAIAIGEHAFNAGFEAAAKFAQPGMDDEPLTASAVAARSIAWDDYTPPDELCGVALS